MYTSGSRQSWDDFVKSEPYFAALSDPRFLRSHLTDSTVREFFQTGESHIIGILDLVKKHLDADWTPGKALDFGCGPGRLIVPLTHRVGKVTGIDRNPHMLDIAKENSRRFGAYEADFHLADELMKGLPQKYDFIHSVIVFQHIPVRDGEKILGRLLDHLEPGGVGALHFCLDRNAPLWRKAINRARIFWPVNLCVNVIQRKSATLPFAQMNSYNPTRLLQILHARGIDNTFLCSTADDQFFGTMLVFQSSRSNLPTI